MVRFVLSAEEGHVLPVNTNANFFQEVSIIPAASFLDIRFKADPPVLAIAAP